MKHSVHGLNTTSACGTVIYLTDDLVSEFAGAKVAQSQAVAEDRTNFSNSATDRVVTGGRYSRSRVHSGGVWPKRKYEDMTSGRIENVAAVNDHEISGQLRFFRQNKKRRPPEPTNFTSLQVQESQVLQANALGESYRQSSKNDVLSSKRRPNSTPSIAVTQENCEKSDLTAENHMAEDSSRSSNNDGSSMAEGATESVSKGSKRESRSSVSSFGLLHSFLDHSIDGSDTAPKRKVLSSSRPSDLSTLARSDEHNFGPDLEKKIIMRDRTETLAKLEPAAGHRHEHGSPVQAPQLRAGSKHQEWLQLGVGASGDLAGAAAVVNLFPGSQGEQRSMRQDTEERVFAKRKFTMSETDFSVADDIREESGHSNSKQIEISNENSPVQWQPLRHSVPPTSGITKNPGYGGLSKLSYMPGTFHSVATSSLVRSIGENSATDRNYDVGSVGKMDLQARLARGLAASANSELVTMERITASNASEFSDSQGLGLPRLKVSGLVMNSETFESRRDGEDCRGTRVRDENEDFASTGMGRSGAYHRIGPALRSTPVQEDIQIIRSGESAGGTKSTDASFQFHTDRENQPGSVLSSIRTSADHEMRQGQARHSWMSPPTSKSKHVPLAKNFQGWSSDFYGSTSTTKSADFRAESSHHDGKNKRTPAMQKAPNEWGSLLRTVGPSMLFRSEQQQLRQSSDDPSPQLKAAGVEKYLFTSQDAAEERALLGLKLAIEKSQNRPQQWTPELPNLGLGGPWSSKGHLSAFRADTRTQVFAGERPLISSPAPPEKVPVHSSIAGGEQSFSARLQQRQSWQASQGTHSKLPQSNVSNVQRPSTSFGKPSFPVLQPGLKGPHSAGLWFILQSGENQIGEGGPPQMSQVYLRIKDGKMPVSTVKKYLVAKLGLTSESEVEITCKGQPVVPSLPLQHVRDVIWFSCVTAGGKDRDMPSTSEEPGCSESSPVDHHHHRLQRPPGNYAAGASMFSKDVLMVLTYRRHRKTLP